MNCISVSSESGTPPHLVLNNSCPSFGLPLVVLQGGVLIGGAKSSGKTEPLTASAESFGLSMPSTRGTTLKGPSPISDMDCPVFLTLCYGSACSA
jgi:hypothetical protein